MKGLPIVIAGSLILFFAAFAQARVYGKSDIIRLREYVSRKWTNELIHRFYAAS